jgi:sigma-E factor negative regulatory protein RseA
MVMNENISRLMDGELDDGELDAACTGLKRTDTYGTWACYHLIGDAMRGHSVIAPGFDARFAARLASEPTVLAPRQGVVNRRVTWAFATAATIAAVTVVGWTAFSLVDDTPAALAKAREAGRINAAQVRPAARVPADYLLAHQEYSPATVLQGVSPYWRAVASPDDVRH